MFICILEMVNAMLKNGGGSPVQRKPGPAPLFDGVKRADWRARPDKARALGAALARRGEVAYWASPEVIPAADMRWSASARTRLGSTTLLDAATRFAGEGRICGLSISGLLLILGRNISLLRRAAVPVDTAC